MCENSDSLESLPGTDARATPSRSYRDDMNVGIRELQAHLSEYVRKAAQGEHVIVTDQGRPVAKLVGLGTSMLERGIAEGWITPPRRSGLTPAVYHRASLSTAEVLDEDRGLAP